MAAAAVSGAKRSLRAELKQRLRAISAEERLRQSRLLTQKVMAHSQYQNSKRISIFLSMQDEIETEEIIKDIFQQGKICFVPRYQFQSNHMDMVKLASPEEISLFPKTSWNIHQPGEGDVREEALSTGGLDLIFMPGLGFDKHGNRLGRGKGYYDTYLKRCLQHQKVKPYTLALAFKEQICLQVPVDEHDMKGEQSFSSLHIIASKKNESLYHESTGEWLLLFPFLCSSHGRSLEDSRHTGSFWEQELNSPPLVRKESMVSAECLHRRRKRPVRMKACPSPASLHRGC